MMLSFLRWLGATVGKVFYRLKIYDNHKVPETGRVIIAGNHTAWFDIVGTWLTTKRRCYIMVKDSIYKHKIFKGFLQSVNTVPVKRGRLDREAYDRTVELLEAENAFIIFPEGTRNKNTGMLEFKDGTARFALTTGSPIVPVALYNFKYILASFPWTKKTAILVGDIIQVEKLPDDADHRMVTEATRELTAKLSQTINDLYSKLEKMRENEV